MENMPAILRIGAAKLIHTPRTGAYRFSAGLGARYPHPLKYYEQKMVVIRDFSSVRIARSVGGNHERR